MRAKYVLSEVVLGLWRNVTMTIAMIITMAVSLSMLGASGLMYLQVNKMKEQYYGELNVAIFLDDEITEERHAELDANLRAGALVREVLFETQEMAYDKFKELYRDAPELVNAIKPEQLPQSFRVKLKDPTQYNQIFEKYKDAEGIDEIIDQRRLLEKIFK